jgi:hypothetical protein
LDVRKVWSEHGGQVVPTRFDEDNVERALLALEPLNGLEVGAHVISDRRMRAAACLDGHDPLRCQRSGGAQELGILRCVDVVRDNPDVVCRREFSAQSGNQRALSGADRPSDADANRAVWFR